jgi:hypothetical protein
MRKIVVIDIISICYELSKLNPSNVSLHPSESGEQPITPILNLPFPSSCANPNAGSSLNVSPL